MPRLSWKRGTDRRIGAPHVMKLWLGTEHLATVQELRDGRFFWYARHDDLGVNFKNTASAPVATEVDAKTACQAYVRAQLDAVQRSGA